MPRAIVIASGGVDVSAIPAIAPRQPLSQWAQAVRPFVGNVGPARAFRAHQAALDLFPGELWSRIAARRLRRGTADLLANGDAAGYRPPREAISADAETIGARLATLGVESIPVTRFALDDPEPFANALILGFPASGPRELRRGFECLARVV